ncbi:unnamed protein product [Meloidogyne enterolobii]|uniref:Uncharacterized protein n=1 Tax=Meloidogyne enterolobii TaxID=390850 RepID=A0ACB0ZL60_MELEN
MKECGANENELIIIDEQISLTDEANMADYRDTLQPLDLAPPKKFMRPHKNCQIKMLLMMPAIAEWILEQRLFAHINHDWYSLLLMLMILLIWNCLIQLKKSENYESLWRHHRK